MASENLTGPEIELKMQLIKSLSEAITRTRDELSTKKDGFSACELQHLEARRAELRATLPRLRVVN